ncbi:hypothetical protein SAMN05216404_106238 [Nitrosospira multiformis]|uniref:Uncharacterized protein n=1 Tax=Nitrosospira multiformis TaxID=1231 RepID=A0A1H8IYY9_9PROT|nr:hypothetical protein [Nitrosospira multiformis]SEN73824.1 hypothetical protein SAMN05216404_106238 [Nitrosospira multiformis]
MSATEIIEAAAREGLSLFIKLGGGLHYFGYEGSAARWLPVIRENKTEILEVLRGQDITAVGANMACADASSYWWRFYYPDGTIKEVSFYPAATRSQALRGEAGAIAAIPFEAVRQTPAAPLGKKDEALLRRWLSQIGETNETSIHVLEQCNTDESMRNYYLMRASEGLAEPC